MANESVYSNWRHGKYQFAVEVEKQHTFQISSGENGRRLENDNEYEQYAMSSTASAKPS